MTALSSSTALTLFLGNATDISVLMYAAIAVIVGIMVGLIGLGFFWRKITRHATGKKF